MNRYADFHFLTGSVVNMIMNEFGFSYDGSAKFDSEKFDNFFCDAINSCPPEYDLWLYDKGSRETLRTHVKIVIREQGDNWVQALHAQ